MMLYTGSNAETMETTIDLQAKNAELMKQVCCLKLILPIIPVYTIIFHYFYI